MSAVSRFLAGLIALCAIPAAVVLIIVLLREVGPCWELYLAAAGLQIGAIKVVAWGAIFTLDGPTIPTKGAASDV